MAGADSSSRPVLRRTQPKVLPKTPPAPKPLKSAPAIAKKPVANNATPPSAETPAKLPTVQIPLPSAAVLKPLAADLSPASVLHDLPCIVDEEDDSSSIASSSSHNSPCFKKDSSSSPLSSRESARSIAKKAQPRKIPEAPPSPATPRATMFPSPQEVLAQRKLKISHYGRKQGSPKAVKIVAPEGSLGSPVPVKKRCGWISTQCDPAYIAYHDEEWGVPVHDDNLLFELLVLAGAQSEMGWSLILSKRDCYRRAFQDFDPAAVAAFDKKKVAALKGEVDIYQQEGKLQAVIENAGRVLQIVQEFGSLSNYLWGFLNHKAVQPNFRTAAQVPIKTSKSEFISKDLVRRGFSCVGPTTIYSLMQGAGMTNDHILQCFRHKECCSDVTIKPKVNAVAAPTASSIETAAIANTTNSSSSSSTSNNSNNISNSVFVHLSRSIEAPLQAAIKQASK